MNYVFIAIALLAAYLLGSVPAAYVMGRLRKGIDIRQVGSRNMGAMNVFYSIGFGEGLAVLAFDIGKGAAAVALARVMATPEAVQLLAGLVAVVGHNFPIFLNFKGGAVNPSALVFRGPARAFDSEEAATKAIEAKKIKPGDVIVIRYEGPRGGPGMREMLAPTAAICGMGLSESVALITDGRFSGGTRGSLYWAYIARGIRRRHNSICKRRRFYINRYSQP